MIKRPISDKKTNTAKHTAKHTANRNFCKKNLYKRNNDERLPQIKNGKLSYFKIDFLFIICLALGIALTTCGERFPSNDHHDNDHHDNDHHDNDHHDNDHHDNDHHDNDHHDNDSSPSSIEYTLKTGELAKFVSTWRADSTISLPLVENGRYDFTIDWGDGTTDTVASWDATEKTHTYGEPGDYTVTITGTIVGWAFSPNPWVSNANAQKLTAVSQWGNLHLGNTAGYQFYEARNLNITASDAPFLHDGDTTYTTDLKYAFARATRLRGNLNNWDVANVTTMKEMFYGADAFNQPLDNWEVGSVTTMERMFSSAVKFNQDINQWDVGNVTTMQGMFARAQAFNQPIGNWNDRVGKVTNMKEMFRHALAFNQPIGNWSVGNVTNMAKMFSGANAFDQPLGNWHDKLGNVTTMNSMFNSADAFNQPIGNWSVGNVTSCLSFARNSGLEENNQPTFTSCDSSAD